MKSNSFRIIALAILVFASKAFSQGHSLQIDDGASHYSTLKGSNPGATFLLPAGPGTQTLLTMPSPGVSPAWLTGGNNNPSSNILGTLTGQDLILQAGGAEKLRLINGDGVSASVALNMNSNQINNLGSPTLPSDAATKAYVDAHSGAGSVAPEVVNWLGAYNAGFSYSQNDLVTSASPDIYYYSLTNSNTGNTPETSPANWQVVTIGQLNTIHKVLTLNSPGFTSLMSIELAGTYTVGGRIQYTIRATDGGAQIATENGIIQYLATTNSITCTVQTNDKLHLGTVNSGCTPGFFNPGSHPGISIFDNVSFSTPAPIVLHDVYYKIINVSGQYVVNGAATPIPLRLEP